LSLQCRCSVGHIFATSSWERAADRLSRSGRVCTSRRTSATSITPPLPARIATSRTSRMPSSGRSRPCPFSPRVARSARSSPMQSKQNMTSSSVWHSCACECRIRSLPASVSANAARRFHRAGQSSPWQVSSEKYPSGRGRARRARSWRQPVLSGLTVSLSPPPCPRKPPAYRDRAHVPREAAEAGVWRHAESGSMRAARLGQAGSGRRLAPHPIGTHSCSAERRHDVIVTTPSHARTACRCGHRDAVFALLASSGVGRVFLAGGCAVLRSSSIAMSRSLGFLLVTSCRFAAKSFAITGCGASEQGAAEVVKSVPQWCPVVRALCVR